VPPLRAVRPSLCLAWVVAAVREAGGQPRHLVVEGAADGQPALRLGASAGLVARGWLFRSFRDCRLIGAVTFAGVPPRLGGVDGWAGCEGGRIRSASMGMFGRLLEWSDEVCGTAVGCEVVLVQCKGRLWVTAVVPQGAVAGIAMVREVVTRSCKLCGSCCMLLGVSVFGHVPVDVSGRSRSTCTCTCTCLCRGDAISTHVVHGRGYGP
jgi:hypothetical protein